MGIRRTFIGFIRRKCVSFMHPNLHLDREGFYCGRRNFIHRHSTVKIGKRFRMGNNCHIAAECIIGDDVVFDSYVSLVGGDHLIDDIDGPMRVSGKAELKTIVIEDNVWIGHRATILQGVTIKSGAVVSAGSIVTKDVDANAIIAGNPATLIRYRKDNDDHATSKPPFKEATTVSNRK